MSEWLPPRLKVRISLLCSSNIVIFNMQCILMYSTDQNDVADESRGKKREAVIASLVSAIGIVLLVLSLYLCYIWKKKKNKNKNDQKMRKQGEETHS